MPSINCARISCVDFETSPVCSDASLVSSAVVLRVIKLLALVLGAASLAACAQSSVVSKRSASFTPSRQAATPSRQAAPERDRTASFEANRRVAAHAAFAPHETPVGPRTASQGLASFYTEGTRTASGEKFDTNELTAAHPTLPFGTRLRVTNVANGQSVTVRINDRGPYVPGRVVDVSYSAARTLGMVGGGVAKVKLDVVQ
jgi:peptidoglycan lytic transglycosylase